MSSAQSYESGLRPERTEFVRESTAGTTPDNPSWNLYSDNARTLDPTIDPQKEAQRGRGSADPVGFFVGTEADSLTVVYDLQTWFSASGDAAYDGLARTTDQRLPNTHTVVRRMEQNDLSASNTVNGSTSKDSRQYFVGKGGYIDEVVITGDPTSPLPILVELTYEFEKGRVIQVDQPGSSTTIDVVSTDANDSGTVTLEDEGAGTSEDVTISANGTATSTSSFSDLDAIELSAEQSGDITIAENGGDNLAVIKGQTSYDHGEGDLGIPALGTSSHASANGTAYELYHDDVIERPAGTTLAEGIETTELTVSNNVDGTEQNGTPRRALSAGDRDVSISATIFGETEYVDAVVDMLTSTSNTFKWTFDGGNLQATNAQLMEVTGTEEPSQSKKMTDATFESEGLTVA